MTIGSAEFEQFVAARWPALFRTAYLLTGDARLAEDVTQSALANTYARRARIRDAHALEAYVRRAQTNLVISASRRPGHRGEQLTDAPPERGGSGRGSGSPQRGRPGRDPGPPERGRPGRRSSRADRAGRSAGRARSR